MDALQVLEGQIQILQDRIEEEGFDLDDLLRTQDQLARLIELHQKVYGALR